MSKSPHRFKTKRDASSSSRITIVDSEEYWRIQNDLHARHGPASKDGYEIWERFDASLLKIFRKYGKAGLDLDSDFHESGDWFHELFHGFVIQSPKVLTTDFLYELQQVVAQHHRDALLLIEGGFESDLFGLRMTITASAIYVACDGESAVECRESLRRFRVAPFDSAQSDS